MSLLLLCLLLFSSHLYVLYLKLLLPDILLGFELALLFFFYPQLFFQLLEFALSFKLGLVLLFVDAFSRFLLSAFFRLRFLDLQLLKPDLIDFSINRIQLFPDLSRLLLLLLPSGGLGILDLLGLQQLFLHAGLALFGGSDLLQLLLLQSRPNFILLELLPFGFLDFL